MISIRTKLFAAILTLAIGFIVVPGVLQNSYADMESEPAAVNVDTGKEYATVNEAIAEPAKGQTVKLLKDIDLGEGYLQTSSSFTFDLNGYTITSARGSDSFITAQGAFCVNNNGNVTVKDSSAEKTGAIICTGNAYSLYTQTRGTLAVESGTFKGGMGSVMCGGYVTINGGEFEGTGEARNVLYHFNADRKVTINGGVFKGGGVTFEWSPDQNHGGTYAINGGYFSKISTRDRYGNAPLILKEGMHFFRVGGDGEYKDYYELKTVVAKRLSGSSETLYPDLQEAFDSATDGDTVVVVADCDTHGITIRKENQEAITLDLNGKTVTAYGIITLAKGTMTIKDSRASDSTEGTGKIDISYWTNMAFDVVNPGTKLILESGTIHAADKNTLSVRFGAEVEVAGGTISGGINGILVGGTDTPENKGTVLIKGGTITGSEYGVSLQKGKVTVTGDKARITSEGRSVGMNGGQNFIINGGRYSDDAGNADGFTRPSGKFLCRYNNTPMYKLGTPEAYNETTEDYIEKLDDAKNLLSGDNDVVKVIKDIDLGSGMIIIWNTFTLDLNGHTVTSGIDADTYGTLYLMNKADLTITDSSEEKTGAVINSCGASTDNGYAIWTQNYTDLTVSHGLIKSNHAGIYAGGTVTINGGKIDAGGRAIYLFDDNTDVTVNDGIVKGSTTFYFEPYKTGQKVAINGGYFSDDKGNDGRINLKDGMRLLQIGGDGEYRDYYELKTVVAKLVSGGSETFYTDLQEAIGDAMDGDTVVVLADLSADSLTIDKEGKAVTLDLAGKTVTEKGVMELNAGDLTIKDSSASEDAEGTGRIEFTKEDGDSTFDVSGENTSLLIEGGTLYSANNTVVRAFEGARITTTGGTISGGECGVYLGKAGSENVGIATIRGGTITGAEYGIYVFNGGAMVTGDEALIVSDGKSIAKEEGALFIIIIAGGTFSDAAGNGEGYLRPGDDMLVKGADPVHPKMYALGTAVAKRQVNGEDILYANLHTAVDDAKEEEDTITLLMDTTDHFEHSNKDSNIILDLNGKMLTVDENEGISVTDNAGIAIKNGTIKPATADVKNIISANDTGFIRLDEGLTIDAAGSSLTAYDGGEIVINGAAVTADLIVDGEESAAGIESGTINGDVKVGTENGSGGVLIEGGTINGEVHKEGDASAFHIKGGKYKTDTGNGKDFVRPDNKYLADPDGDGWYELEDVDKSGLEQAISQAKAAEEGVAVSEDGKDVDPEKQWTSSAEKEALDKAIAAAQDVADSKTATQKDIDAAVTAVKEATEAYNKAKKAGTKPAPEPQPDKDPDAITPSESVLANAAVDNKLAVDVKKITTSAKFPKKTMTVKWKKVKNATNYKVAYRKAGAKKWTETWTKGKNSIVLKKMKKNGLYEFKLMAVRKNGSTWTKSKWSKVNYRFYAATKQKVKAGRKSVTVKMKKVKKATGYEILTGAKATISTMKVKTFKGGKKVTRRVKGLKSGKKVFVRSRPYRTYKGHKYIGVLNKARKVKIK